MSKVIKSSAASGESLEFGRYTLVKKLATGGMAEVYLAQQKGLEGFEKLLVIKRILPQLADDDEFIEMFLNEARIAARFTHPNIVQIFDLGKEGGSYFIAMEYVHGEDLGRVMKAAWENGHWVPQAIALRLTAAVCEGLYYAHSKTDERGNPLKVVHRDISPQNVIVSFDGNAKLVDFGIARAADSGSTTKTGAIKGKFSYMSPEQATGKELDARSDIFATGLILYELLTGTRPLKRDSDIKTLRAAADAKFDRPSAIANVPAELDDVVLRALAREPADRYPDARAFQLALEDALVALRWNASTIHISEFMRGLFSERLQEESRLGRPAPRSDSGVSNRKVELDAPVELKSSEIMLLTGTGTAPRAQSAKPAPPAALSGDWDLSEKLSDEQAKGPAQAVTAFERVPEPQTEAANPMPDDAEDATSVEPAPSKKDGPPASSKRDVPRTSKPVTRVKTPAAKKSSPRMAKAEPRRAAEPPSVQLRGDPPPKTKAKKKPADDIADLRPMAMGADDPEPRSGFPIAVVVLVAALAAGGWYFRGKLEALKHPDDLVSVVEEQALDKDRASLSLESNVTVDVSLGKKVLGQTPLKGADVPAGRLELVLSNPNLGIERKVTLTAAKGARLLHRETFATGKLRVKPDQDCDVYLQGRKVGRAPGPMIDFFEGSYELECRNEGLGLVGRAKVVIPRDRKSPIDVPLKLAPMDASPPGAAANDP